MQRFVGERRLAAFREWFAQRVAISTAIAALIPPPFPFTAMLLTCGAIKAPTFEVIGGVAVARVARFVVDAWLARHLGTHILWVMKTAPFRWGVGLFIALAVAGTAWSAWKAMRHRSALMSLIVSGRNRHYCALVDDDFFAPKTLQLVLTLRWWPAASRQRGWRRKLRGFAPFDGIELARRDRDEAVLVMSRLSEHANVLARTLGVEARPIDGQRLLEILWRLLNPGSSHDPPAWDRLRPMNHQVAESAAVFRPDAFALGPLEGHVVSLLGLPPATRPGHFTLSPEPGAPSTLLRRPGFGWTVRPLLRQGMPAGADERQQVLGQDRHPRHRPGDGPVVALAVIGVLPEGLCPLGQDFHVGQTQDARFAKFDQVVEQLFERARRTSESPTL